MVFEAGTLSAKDDAGIQANTVANALSRAPPPSSQEEGRVMQMSQEFHPASEPGDRILSQVRQQQQQDPELVKLYCYLKTRVLPDDPQEAKIICNLA